MAMGVLNDRAPEKRHLCVHNHLTLWGVDTESSFKVEGE